MGERPSYQNMAKRPIRTTNRVRLIYPSVDVSKILIDKKELFQSGFEID